MQPVCGMFRATIVELCNQANGTLLTSEQVLRALVGGGVTMTQRLACPSRPVPLEDYAASFDDLFGSLAQRRGFARTCKVSFFPASATRP